MAEERLDYPKFMERAMRGVVRDALAHAAERGLPGNHHFYITFRTTEPDVVMSKVLRAQHPEEMTIVLQHKFWNLAVDETGFGVELSFGGVRQQLYIPFTAIASFVDPSVNFGFRMDAAELPSGEGANAAPTGAAPAPEGSAEVVPLDSFRKK